MYKKIFVILFVILGVSRNGFAYNPIENGEIDIYEAYNKLAGTIYTDNKFLNYNQINSDSFWNSQGGNIIPISSAAGNNNSVFVYERGDLSSQTFVYYQPGGTFGYLGEGTNSNPYNLYNISNMDFGMQLESNGALYDSNMEANLGGRDHMVAYTVSELVGKTVWVNNNGTIEQHTFKNPTLVGWEDLDLGDQDYNDVLYLTDNTTQYDPLTGISNQITNINNTQTTWNMNQDNSINTLNSNINNVNNYQSNWNKNQDAQLANHDNSINDLDRRLKKQEQRDYTVTGKIRWYDGKKWEVENYAKWSYNDRNVSEVGLEITYKFGRSYEEKRIDELQARLELLEVKNLTKSEEKHNMKYAKQNYNVAPNGNGGVTVSQKF